ncbi:flagellar hook-length control protein FliK [Pusillimonas sp. CC-YST705]|uniref:Flagellar hook-length control protein FliK n=1 Tax=Mesopusillimonas faecipullorum TaxID=2755040 RepID=A0ABS8C9Y1_9BURK|nr:flagellar hook-length control protein FliK [Mesopusillimonas faecipullorum]MCB5362832.1 flagellar hook-length control protein FliK [Mesopusillimonas faecipullorum]
MTMMPVSTSQLSAQPAGTEQGGLAERRHPEGEQTFPQLLASQRPTEQPRAAGARTPKPQEDPLSSSESSQAEEAARQLLADFFPNSAPQVVAQQASPLHPEESVEGASPALHPPAASRVLLSAYSADALNSSSAVLPEDALVQNGILTPTKSENTWSQQSPAGASPSLRKQPAAGSTIVPTRGMNGAEAVQRFTLTDAQQTEPAQISPLAASPRSASEPGSSQLAAPVVSEASVGLSTVSSVSQTTGLPATTISPGASTLMLSIAPSLEHPAWGRAMAQQVGHALQSGANGTQQAELRLDPPDLGPLRVTLQIQDNVAHAWFVSSHASVRQAVESALPHLAQQLADAGLSLGNTHVGSDQAGQQPPPAQASRSTPAILVNTADTQSSAPAVVAKAAESHLIINTYA